MRSGGLGHALYLTLTDPQAPEWARTLVKQHMENEHARMGGRPGTRTDAPVGAGDPSGGGADGGGMAGTE